MESRVRGRCRCEDSDALEDFPQTGGGGDGKLRCEHSQRRLWQVVLNCPGKRVEVDLYPEPLSDPSRLWAT